MVRDIGEQVVVLTGASSGIGRDTALEFARRGAKLVLAARNREALDTLVDEVERLGGVAVAVATDVSDYDQVTELASRAVERFGRIDTWVNNASVSTYGTRRADGGRGDPPGHRGQPARRDLRHEGCPAAPAPDRRDDHQHLVNPGQAGGGLAGGLLRGEAWRDRLW